MKINSKKTWPVSWSPNFATLNRFFLCSFYSWKYILYSWLQLSSMIFQQFFQFFIELFKSGKFLIIFSRGAWRKSFEAFRNPSFWTIITFNNLIGNKHWKLSVIESCAIVVLFLDAGFNNVCLCTWQWNVLLESFAITNVKITLINTKMFNNCICSYITLNF